MKVRTEREAMLFEAIDDVAALMERLQALLLATEDSRAAMLQAHDSLAAQIRAAENRLTAVTEHAKTEAVKYIARKTQEAGRTTIDAQVRALGEAGRELFRTELGPALQAVRIPLQHVAEMARRGAHPWHTWLTHAATALVSCSVTLGLAAWLWAA